MKYFIFSLFLFSALSIHAQQKQSLKDLLYSGKLKKDSSGIIRKTDDLSSKIDTTTKIATAPEKPTAVIAALPVKVVAVPVNKTDAVVVADTTSKAIDPTKESAVPAKTNTRIWKGYTDSLVKSLKAEVLHAKQIKKETYYVTIEYEINVEGQVNFVNVTSTPENSFLQAQVKQRLDTNPLQLNPVLDSSNQPKKVKRKQNFSVTKE